jgi:hypothetical protein
MTSITTNEDLAAITEEKTPRTDRMRGIPQKVLSWLEAIADRLNPILVKETRQALKSRQFVLTFLVVLIACWIASFAVVMIVGPDIFYGAEGPAMLMVYCCILAFPLIIIVPFSAFRSLAAEQEDNTYELLSITTLTSRQVIMGKLGSAIVQMLVYLSAVSPCIAFTFLLRGVDAVTVAVVLGYYVLASLGLSILALLLGTLARVRYVHALLQVVLVLGLGGVFISSIALLEEFTRWSYRELADIWFWIGNLAFLTFYATTFALVHEAAAAQIAFSSENRSSRLRYLMVLQHSCFLGWMAFVFAEESGARSFVDEFVLILSVMSGCYWYAMGTLLTSEWPLLSRRVQRSLPQSELGRALFTWFNPGPGTGYMFIVANLAMVVTLGIALILSFGINSGGRWIAGDTVICFLLLGWAYIVLFLGAGRLLISYVRQFTFVSLTAGFLLHIILVLFGCGIPMMFSYLASSFRYAPDYSLLHVTNPFWTLFWVLDHGASGVYVTPAMIIVGSAAVIVLLLNVRLMGAEIHLQRRALPQRIAEEEAELHPKPEPKPTSPWDDLPARSAD